MPKVYCICGPTASGKSNLAFTLAKAIDAEIVSADSMQIYQDMNIGTAKISRELMEIIPHHMLDIIKPTDSYSVANYSKDATWAIHDILQREKNVVICGGTGQYINALLDGLIFIDIQMTEEIRHAIAEKITAENAAVWHQKMEKLDPLSAGRIAKTDLRRIRRFFEVYSSTNLTQSEINKRSRAKGPDFEFVNFYLKPEREILYARINQRVGEMFEQGLIEEVRFLLEKYPGVEQAQSFQAIGYKETLAYLKHEKCLEDVMDTIKKVTRNYAKRQFTWFNARKDLIPLNCLDMQENLSAILRIIR